MPAWCRQANKRAIEAAGLGFILGAKTPQIPYVIEKWRRDHPAAEIPDGHIFTQPWPAGATDRRKDHVFYYRYSAVNARRTLKGIDEQVRKAEAAVAGRVPVKRNRFVHLKDAKKSVNRELEAKARGLAGIKGYVTNRIDQPAEVIIDAYRRLFQIEKSFRMAKSDLQARPIYARMRDSIDAHLTSVLAALAVSRWLEEASGMSIKRLVKTLRRYRRIEITLGDQTIAAETTPPRRHRSPDQQHPRPSQGGH